MMFRVKRKTFTCPHCEEEISEVSNWEVDVNKSDVVLSVCMGSGFGLFASAAWYITWWGALGVAFMAAVLTFLVQAVVKGRRKEYVGKKDAEGNDSD